MQLFANRRNRKQWMVCLSVLVCAFYSTGALAAGTTAAEMLIRLSEAYEPVVRLITASAYVVGVLFVFRALYHLKIYGELRTMMASQTSLKEPAAFLLAAGMLIYLPTGFEMMLNTTFGYERILDYEQWEGAGSSNYDVMVAVFKIVQIIGYIAFVRGWMLLAKSAQQGAQGTFGKGIIHVFSGVFAINIVGTADMLSNTFGLTFT